MTTARDLIKSSFRLIGVYQSGENPTSDEINDALLSLNTLKDSLNLDNQMSYQTLNNTYTFIANQADYTWSPTGDWVITPTPVQISKVTIRDLVNDLDFPCQIITESDYADIALKGVASPIPEYVTINEQADNSKKLTFWTVPSSTSYGATLYYESYVGAFALDTAISLPPGYERMFKYNLAIEIAPEYGAPIAQEVMKIAADSLASVKRQNYIPQRIGVDAGITSNQSIYTYADFIAGT